MSSASDNNINEELIMKKSYVLSSDRKIICPKCLGEGTVLSRKRRRSKKKGNLRHQKQQEKTATRINVTTTLSTNNNSTNESNNQNSKSTTELNNLLSSPPEEQHSPRQPQHTQNRDPCKHCESSGLVHDIENSTSSQDISSGQNNIEIPIPPKDFEVAIIGGGIGGLALALACSHRSIPCTVYERDLSFEERSQGYGLTMQQGAKALQALGFFMDRDPNGNDEDEKDVNNENSNAQKQPRLLGKGIHSKHHIVHRHDGTIVGEWGMRKWGRRKKKQESMKKQNVHISRQELRRLLLDELQMCKPNSMVKWGHKLIEYTECFHGQEHNNISIRFEKRNSQGEVEIVTKEAAALVGADGIRSKVRSQKITDEISPLRYLGCIVILGIAASPASSFLTNDGETVFQTADGVTRLYAMPFSAKGLETAGAAKLADNLTLEGNGETMWQLSFPMSEQDAIEMSSKGPEALKLEALKRCKNWHAPCSELLQSTPLSLVSGYPVYDRELLDKQLFRTGKGSTTFKEIDISNTNKVTFIGDAAHPMSPFKGQGERLDLYLSWVEVQVNFDTQITT